MLSETNQRAAKPFLEALPTCTDHLSDDELYEVCASGGEAELNDLLRHAANRLARPRGWIVQREQTRPGLYNRVDITMSEMASDSPLAVLEAKMFYASDLLDITNRCREMLARDAAKLKQVVELGQPPAFLLAWVPHYTTVNRKLRHMKGHRPTSDGWTPRHDLDETRSAATRLLADFGDVQRVHVRTTSGYDGSVVLEAHLVRLLSV